MEYKTLAWGRCVWWTLPPPGGNKLVWKVNPQLRLKLLTWALISKARLGWPRELMSLVMEWIVNTYNPILPRGMLYMYSRTLLEGTLPWRAGTKQCVLADKERLPRDGEDVLRWMLRTM